MLTYSAAESACEASGGYLVTITSAVESARVIGLGLGFHNPWIGAQDGADDDVFEWVTGEPLLFWNFAQGQPDDNGECVHLNGNGTWDDTDCSLTGFVTGRICEIELKACGDSVVQAGLGEECDDGNTVNDDLCSNACTSN